MQGRYQKGAILRDRAKKYLSGRYGNAILVCLLFALVRFCLSIPGLLVENIFVSYLVSFVMQVFSGMMNAGLALYFLKLCCGQVESTNDLFIGYTENPKQVFLLSLYCSLPSFICMLPSYIVDARTYSPEAFFPHPYVIILALIGHAIYGIIELGLSICFFVLQDFPQYSAFEIVKLSWKTMKGHKWRLFLIQLGFLPLILLCMFSFGIGFAWLMPFMAATMALFYFDLIRPADT